MIPGHESSSAIDLIPGCFSITVFCPHYWIKVTEIGKRRKRSKCHHFHFMQIIGVSTCLFHMGVSYYVSLCFRGFEPLNFHPNFHRMYKSDKQGKYISSWLQKFILSMFCCILKIILHGPFPFSSHSPRCCQF